MIRTIATYLALAAVLSALYLGGALDPLEQRLMDWRFRLVDRNPQDKLLIVAIDSRSLGAIGTWPWSRQLYADAIDRLIGAGATRVAVNIDFSSASDTAGDSRLEESLARAGASVVLPGFVQEQDTGTGASGMVFTAPLPRFARWATVAAINLPADGDGVVRRMLREVPWPAGVLPTLSTVLARPGTPLPEGFYIDYGIDAAQLHRISFVDVLEGRFDRAAVSGRRVIVGAAAGELGDMFQTPRFGLLPGAVVHALAIESLEQGRALWRLPPVAILAGIFAIVFGLGRFSTEHPRRAGLAAAGGITVASALTALGLQATTPAVVEIVPWVAAAVLTYGLALAHTVTSQDLRLLAQKIAIRRKETYVRKLEDAAFDGIMTVDDEGLIRSANRRAEEMFGLPQEQMIGRSFTVFLSPTAERDGNELVLDELAALDGAPQEVTGLRSTGGTFEASLAVTSLPDDDYTFFVMLVLDVSARRRAEAEVADTRRRLAEALESISDGIVLWDRDDRLLTCNSRFTEFHGPVAHVLSPGCRFEDFVSQLAMMGASPDAEGREGDWLRERLARHRTPEGSFVQQAADGRRLRVVERRTADGGIIGVETDVTDDFLHAAQLQRAREAAEAASLAKTRFLANMSHELRTPLNAVLGFSEVIRDGAQGATDLERCRSYAADIHESGLELLQMVNDILEIARIEAGETDLSEGVVDPAELIADCARTLAATADRAHVSLSIDIAKELPRIRADRRRLRQCLVSLIDLAIRNSPEAGEATVRAGLDGTAGLRISVTDSGPGLGNEVIARALDPFGPIRSDISIARPADGLALPLANMRMRQHGGRLELFDHPDGGTTATLFIPPERVLAGLAEVPRRS